MYSELGKLKPLGLILLAENKKCAWPWRIRNSIQQPLEMDFLSGDLTSCFTSRGDQTVLGGVKELAFRQASFFMSSFLSFVFSFSFSLNCMLQKNSQLLQKLSTTSLNLSWLLEH
jgi:hypothetical protein